MERKPTPPRLALLVDADPDMRRIVRPLLAPFGLEVIQSRTSVAALDLLQRLPERFRVAIVSLEMPDLSGTVVIETIGLFRTGVATLCLTSAERPTIGAGGGLCLSKPPRTDELRAQLVDALAGASNSLAAARAIPPDALERARASFAASGSLLDAARELARGRPEESAGDW